jgi:Ser/Thr protein kinase RdoA (MazF antagonist)
VLDRCDRFEARWHEIETFFEGIPRTVVHGDFHLYNVCVQRRSHDVGLVPFDYADAGWGVPAADLAHFPGDGFAYSVQPDLPTYQAMVAGVWPRLDAHDIHLLAEFGTAFRAFSELWWESWRISYPYESDRERVWLTEFIDSARVYLARMDEVAAAAGWER